MGIYVLLGGIALGMVALLVFDQLGRRQARKEATRRASGR